MIATRWVGSALGSMVCLTLAAGCTGPGANTCASALDGECDEPSYCDVGTDATDCGDDSCASAHDGECDEPGFCPFGTDRSDCLAGLVAPAATPSCTPTTCAAQNAECGTLSNGCGATLACGSCPVGESCTNQRCVATTCIPRTCAQLGADCGTVANGCGGMLDCGACIDASVPECLTNTECAGARVCRAGYCVANDCTSNGDCSASGGSWVCDAPLYCNFGGNPGWCLARCDQPIDSRCLGDTRCIVRPITQCTYMGWPDNYWSDSLTWVTTCSTYPMTGTNPLDSACTSDSDCAEGLVCQGSGGGSGHCRALCSASLPCAGGRTCTYEQVGLSLGVCTTPCDTASCTAAHRSQCDDSTGTAQCVCDPGYVEFAGVCKDATPCDPNPCTGWHKTQCTTLANYGSACSCDPGYVPYSATECTVACTPNCTGKTCGSDGCGGSCGTCGTGSTCSAGTCVAACVPNCTGKTCGSDGCGGSCGTCGTGATCSAGACVSDPNACDPVRNTGCAAPNECWLLSSEQTACALTGAGRQGSYCSSTSSCDGGYGCFANTCRKICDVVYDSGCAIGEVCNGVSGWLTYGACAAL